MHKSQDDRWITHEFPILKGKKLKADISRIFIEISGKCNANCPYCARHNFKERFAGETISADLFEKILDHLYFIGLIRKNHSNPIYLYNWGEPFLNPEINSILEVLKRKKLFAAISSNFIVKPEIAKENFSVIKEIMLSLSGFSQESYGKIHGGSLNKVLRNFHEFYEKVHLQDNINFSVSWHRYKFNEEEFWTAYQHFDELGVNFYPVVAVLNEYFEMFRYYTKGILPINRQKQAENDLFLSRLAKKIDYYKKFSNNYHCAQWNYLVIDETGKLLLCCGMTNKDSDHVLGNILEMSAEMIWENKLTDPLCVKCISSGLAGASTQLDNLTLPPGGKWLSRYKLEYLINLRKTILFIKELPGGKNAISLIKKILPK